MSLTTGTDASRCVRMPVPGAHGRIRSVWLGVLAGCIGTALMGCAGPATDATALSSAAGVTISVVMGNEFEHRVVVSDDADAPPDQPLWIYIEGDGTPWLSDGVPAPDPTPRALVALEMMLHGPRPAVYIGRPCYFGMNASLRCRPESWTDARFGPGVVRSMSAAIDRVQASPGRARRRLVLVGFSGGGTLAALLAADRADACALVTVASPLDIDEWTDSHDYSRLDGSLNPARSPPLVRSIGQLHLRGRRDRIVAPTNGAAFFRANPEAAVRLVEEAGHGREWIDEWRRLTMRAENLPLSTCGPR